MHYMLVTSITLPLQAASNGRNYMHYMAHYMLSKMLMIGSPLILTAPASGRGIRPGVMRIVTPSTKCPATARAHS